jgi:AhpD family alkylhydroperoxidase
MGPSAPDVMTGLRWEPRVRPKLTSRALRRWVPPLARHAPALATAYLLPGRVPPRTREAAMLGVTSVNRCEACEAVHDRWARSVGLRPDALSAGESVAYAFGQRLAVSGPDEALPPAGLSSRHRRELMAVSILMELANLAGNRFLARRPTAAVGLQVADLRTARVLDAGMRVADRLGLRHARARVVGGARGDTLEIGIGTGSNLGIYPADAVVHGIDVSAPALSLAAARAGRVAHRVTLVEGSATALPFADSSFDTVVGTFVLCSVGDVGQSLREARRVLRPGGTIRLLEHARAGHRAIGALQDWSAPAWARVSGGCRLDHDVLRAVREAGLVLIEARQWAGGLLVEIAAA